RDQVAPPAIVAYAATGDVIHDGAVAHIETPATGTDLDDLSTRFVAGDHSLVAFRTFAEMFVVDCADVGAADGRSPDRNENLTVTWFGHRHNSDLDRAVSR